MAAGSASAHPKGLPSVTATAAFLFVLLCLVPGPHVAAAPSCPDFQPPGEFTCADQKRFGKCDAGWMVNGGFCEQTCGRCPSGAAASPAEEQLRASLNAQRLVLTPITLSNATAPAAERPGVTQALRRPAPATELPFFQPQRLPAAPTAERRAPAAERAVQPAQRRPAQAPAAEAVQVLPAVAFLPPVTEPNATAALPALPFLYNAPRAEAAVAPVAEPGCDASKTAWSVLSSDPDLSTTRQAVQALNLTSVLQSPNINFTLFAPTNEAWNAAARAQGQTPPQLLAAAPAARDLLFTHIVPNRVLTVPEMASQRFIITQSNVPLFVSPRPRGQGVTLLSAGGAANTTAPPVRGCNFAVYKIDGVLRSTPAEGMALNRNYAAALSGGGAGAAPTP